MDGHQTGGFPLPDGADLVPNLPWSPDGTRIPVSLGGGSGYGFVDLDQSKPYAGTVLFREQLIGWRSPSSVVVLAPDGGSGGSDIVDVSLVDGRRTVLSRFPTNDRCGLFSVCQVYEIQLASGLLATAVVRDSDPDRGPWLPLYRAGVTAAGATLAFAVGRWWERRRRQRW